MEYSRGQLLSIYEDIEQERKQRDEYISMVQKKDAEIQVKILEYRIASVSRILDYIHTKQFDKNFDINYVCVRRRYVFGHTGFRSSF